MTSVLKEQTVVVIGGSSGFGLATVEMLDALGARVIVGSRNENRLAAAKAAFPALVTRQVDITDRASTERFFADVEMLDHLVVTAAELPSGRLAETNLDKLRPAIESRLFGSLHAVQRAVPVMRTGGSVVLFSGQAARKGFPGESMGAASCGAIESLVRTLAVELAPIRFNALCPGSAWTPVFRAFFGDHAEEAAEKFGASLPLKRLARTSEIAHAVVFLLENTYVTGSTLVVDGGFGVT